jgi:hypothetical protein
MFETERPHPRGKAFVWKWSLPHHFPPGKSLRVVLDRGTLRQGGIALEPDRTGAYTILLDTNTLEWTSGDKPDPALTPPRVATASVGSGGP